MKDLKIQRGITLIALIITIIVLLILAGVAISTLTGENGILLKASTAKQETIKQGAKEKVQVEVMGSYGADGKINLKELNNNLKNNISGLTYQGKPIAEDNKIETLSAIVEVDGYKVKIHENGKVTIDGEVEEGEKDPTPNPPIPEEPEPEEPKTVEEAKKANVTLSTTDNTTITDDFGNQIVVPAGFKIAEDSATSVTSGVVIEDVSHLATAESQFVWIPVGKVYTDINKTEAKAKTINLSRYTFAEDGTATAHGEKVVTINLRKEYGSNYGDDNVDFNELAQSNLGNTTAVDLEEFKTKANSNHGYYIGRYEARTGTKRNSKTDQLGQITVKKNDFIYNYVTQLQAASVSQKMYEKESKFTSDLMNSYAWDTALVFLQMFDDRTNKIKPYSRQDSLNTGSVAPQGTNNLGLSYQDKICNIWDMANNCIEFTTESYLYRRRLSCNYQRRFYLL